MAKIVLGARPKSFARVVTFTDIDGTELSIPVTYKYRTRKEYGAFIDALNEEAKKAGGEAFTMSSMLAKTDSSNIEYLMQVLDGWGLDVDFSRDAVQQMMDEAPGAANAIMETYRLAIVEGRLGN